MWIPDHDLFVFGHGAKVCNKMFHTNVAGS
jgi:hypothetical protein